jgi:UPF0271 protein
MAKSIKLINCDLGECLDPDPDSQIMRLINQASIACGGHVGNNDSMNKTVKLAKQYQVSIGAHPSYPDKANFGRVSLPMSLNTLFDSVLMQVNGLEQVCLQQNVKMDYIKPHGALYHDMMHQKQIVELLCDVIKAKNKGLKLIVQGGINTKQMLAVAMDKGIQLQFEAFADRAYQGVELKSRSEQGAVLASPEEIKSQYQKLTQSDLFQIDTICFHSDHASSLTALQQIKTGTAC